MRLTWGYFFVFLKFRNRERSVIFNKPPRTPEYLAHKLIKAGLQDVTEEEL